PMKVALFSKEYPPNVYGGAGVHVEYLSRALAKRMDVEVRAFGDDAAIPGNPSVRFYPEWPEAKCGTDPRFAGAVDAFERSLRMAKDRTDADLVHCHTWYTDMAGIIAAQLWDIPSVLTIHSLEPLRPWKVEQLGQAYHLSAWMERTAIEQASAIIAVSNETRDDVLRLFDVAPDRVHVIHNGIDLDEYRPSMHADVLDRHGIDRTRPYVLFVGRITRQKGILHLLAAIPHLDPALQVVLCAGAPDTPEIGREMAEGVQRLQQTRPGIIWIPDMLPRPDVIQLYTHAALFCCPSVYEPFGIINLEAMACRTPVVASAVGGIKEVVVPEETGILVDPGLKPGSFEPADPAAFALGLAEAINRLAEDAGLQARMADAGLARVRNMFTWDAIASKTEALYRAIVTKAR
ncbi:MAG: glycogen synthase, partial [Janthinobacterium lividum]